MSASEPDSAVSAAPVESASRTLLVTFVVCLVCSVVVAGAAVLLRPIQESNQKADLIGNVIAVSGLLEEGLTEEQALKRIDARMVELATGDEVKGVDPDTFNIVKAGKDPAISTELPRREDVAGIRREPRYLPVYRIVDDNGDLKTDSAGVRLRALVHHVRVSCAGEGSANGSGPPILSACRDPWAGRRDRQSQVAGTMDGQSPLRREMEGSG